MSNVQPLPSFDAALSDARTATRNAQALADDYKATADRLREELGEARRWARRWKQAARQERGLAWTLGRDGYLSVVADRLSLSRQLAELSQLVGAETPIAAFTLAQSWYAEKAAYQEEIAGLRQERRALWTVLGERDDAREELSELRSILRAARIYVDRMTIQVGPVAHDEQAHAKRVLFRIDNALFEAALTPGAAGEGET